MIFYVTPSDPARLAAGQGASPADVERVAERLHLDEPVWQQYGRFLWQLVGERSLGESFVNRQDVNDIVLRAAPVTAALVFGGAILRLALSIPIGIMSALRPRSLVDRAGMVFVLIGLSAHPVWIGLIFAYFIGFKLELNVDFVPAHGGEVNCHIGGGKRIGLTAVFGDDLRIRFWPGGWGTLEQHVLEKMR